MAQRSRLSTERRLQRELKHRAWLRQHMPNTAQYRACQRRILVLRTELMCAPQIRVDTERSVTQSRHSRER
jgi:hypothetical protein